MNRRKGVRQRGFLLLEVALAMVVMGGLMALLIPLLSMQSRLSGVQQDALAMQQARDALMRVVFDAWGLPGPLQFLEGSNGSSTVTSHLQLKDPQVVLDPGWVGALPGSALGVPTVSTLQTTYVYDVNPALRSESANAFYPQVLGSGSSAGFKPVVQQFDPAINSKLSSGGLRTQLCRNLNSLLAIEQGMRAWTSGSAANYQRNYVNVLLPRFWTTGYESHFGWDDTLGYATHTPETLDAAFENSSAAAFVVVRRQPPALRRLDRQNSVYGQVTGTGMDLPKAQRALYPAAGAARGFRIYENPSTAAQDNPTADSNDYDGRVQAVSLNELGNAMRSAGVCVSGAESCKANQLFVRFANYVNSAPVSGSAQALSLRWELLNKDLSNVYTVVQSGDVSGASTSAGVCLDAFSTDVADSTNNRYMRVSFVSPTGSIGYADGAAAGYWYRGGLLVDPDSTQASTAADDGVTRWRNLDALSAAQAGRTVTVSCTGSHTLLASNELNRSGALKPTCTVTQLP